MKIILALALTLATPLTAQQRTITELWLPAGAPGASFGDEGYEPPFDMEFRLAAIPAGDRHLARLGPLELNLLAGSIEMRVALYPTGEAFTSLPVVAGDLIRGTVAADSATLEVAGASIILPGIIPSAAPGVFTIGAATGPEFRVLDFKSEGGLLFSDGFESGDFSAWEECTGCLAVDEGTPEE